MTTIDTAAQPGAPVRSAWWREPMMWLVIGGPLTVVVAGVATAVIAMSAPDPVLRPSEAAPTAMRPALQARNHAAAPLPATPGGDEPGAAPTQR